MSKRKWGDAYNIKSPPGEILYLYFKDKLVATFGVLSDGSVCFSGNTGFAVKKKTADGEYEEIERREIA